MAAEKKGFVLYFDACADVMRLPPDQRGWLLSVVYTFAKACAEDPEADLEKTLARFPELRPETTMACYFLCGSIVRDTKKWYAGRERQSRAARQRQAHREPDGNGGMPYPACLYE